MKNKFKYSLILFIFSIVGITYAQENKKLEKIIAKVKKQEYLFKNYELKKRSLKYAKKIYKNANKEELIILSKTQNCKLCFSYAFWIMSKKNFEYTSKLYEETNKKFNRGELTQLNEFKRNRSHLKMIISEQNFIYGIHKKGKYLNEIN